MSRALPSLTAIRAFDSAGRHLSFTKAADDLCVTQAAVSHQIKALEDWLGVDLFRREVRGISLTQAGQALLSVTRESLDNIAFVASQLKKEAKEDRSTLLVRITPFVSAHWLLPRLDDFTLRHPDIDLRLFHTQATLEPENEEYDIAIYFGHESWPGHVQHRLFDGLYVPLCSPDISSQLGKNPSAVALAGCTLIYEPRHDWWAEWFVAAGNRSLVPSRRLYIDDPSVLVEAAVNGRGVILAPVNLLASYLGSGKLVAPFGDSPNIRINYFLLYKEKATNYIKVTKFRDWVIGETEKQYAEPASILER